MYCTSCGKELPEEANVCPECGAKVDKSVNIKNVKAYTEQKAKQASANFQDKSKEERNKAAENKKINPVSDMFARPDEQQIMMIEGRYIRNLFSGAGLSREVGVITDRRLYYRGKNYSGSGSFKEEYTVDLQDITSTGFCYMSSLICIIIAVLHLIVGCVMVMVRVSMSDEIASLLGRIGCTVMLLSVLWLLDYFLSKRTLFIITYGGGSLGINVSFFGLSVIRTFDKNLHIAKEERLKECYQYGGGSN